ncbi:MAG: acylphosphatase [Verrucomicrobiota bacterium]
MKRLEAYFTGTVQGVGFRYTAQQVAAGYDLMGTVRNLVDGRVELFLEGEESEIQAYLAELDETHLHDRIKEKELKWMDPKKDLKGFRILR